MKRDVSDIISSKVMEKLNEGKAKSAACAVPGKDYRWGGDGRVK